MHNNKKTSRMARFFVVIEYVFIQNYSFYYQILNNDFRNIMYATVAVI